MAAHTAGPWLLKECGDDDRVHIAPWSAEDNEYGPCIFEALPLSGQPPGAEQKANALLLPRMLAALEEIAGLDVGEDPGWAGRRAREIARAALR